MKGVSLGLELGEVQSIICLSINVGVYYYCLLKAPELTSLSIVWKTFRIFCAKLVLVVVVFGEVFAMFSLPARRTDGTLLHFATFTFITEKSVFRHVAASLLQQLC